MKLLKDLAITMFGLVILLFCLEGSLRLLNIHFQSWVWRIDPVLGFAWKPNAEGWEATEGLNFFRINSDGMRDSEHAIIRPRNTLRIAVLGSSMTAALQVPLEKTNVSVFERVVQDCVGGDGPNIEVLNFSTGAYNMAQRYYELDRKVWKYNPQVVLVALFLYGDVISNSRKLGRSTDPPHPYFTIKDGKLTPDFPSHGFALEHPELSDAIFDLTNRFELLKMTKRAVGYAARSFHDEIGFRLGHATRKGSQLEVGETPDELAYLPPSDPEMQTAWAVTEDILQLVKNDVRAHGAAFQVVTLDMPKQTIPGKAVRKEFARKLGISDLDYPNRRIQRWCREHGVTCFDLGPELQAIADQQNIYLHGFSDTEPGTGHYNETGNYYAGRTLGRQYCEFLHNSDSGREILRSGVSACALASGR